MGYTFSFADNKIYGTDDINSAFSRLTIAGITPYAAGSPITSGMNQSISELVNEGVSYYKNGCLATVLSPGTLKISEGTAFFFDGFSIEIDSDGAILSYDTSQTSYIYLVRDVAENTAYPTASTTALTGDGVIPIASVNGSDVTDLRVFAISRVLPNTSNIFKSCTTPTLVCTGALGLGTEIYTVNVGFGDFKYLLATPSVNLDTRYLKLDENVLTEYISFTNGNTKFGFKKSGSSIIVFGQKTSTGLENVSLSFLVV